MSSDEDSGVRGARGYGGVTRRVKRQPVSDPDRIFGNFGESVFRDDFRAPLDMGGPSVPVSGAPLSSTPAGGTYTIPLGLPDIWTMDSSTLDFASESKSRTLKNERQDGSEPVAGKLEEDCQMVREVFARWLTRGPDARQKMKSLERDLQELCVPSKNGSGEPSLAPKNAYDSSSSDEGSARRRIRFKNPITSKSKLRSPMQNTFSTGNESAILDALQRLDNRTVPKPEEFDADSGQSFETFISLFEEYCKYNYRGSSSLWIGEFGRLLKGDIKLAFDALKIPGDNYDAVKHKLVKWMADRREQIEVDTKRKFTTAKINVGESPSLYAARLEKKFRLAYPRREVETSRKLIQKYLDTVPDDFRNQLLAAKAMMRSMSQQDLTWSTVLFHACQYEMNSKRKLQPDPALTYVGDVHVDTSGIHTYSSRWPIVPGPTALDSRTRCTHCQKEGHSRANCRKLLNQCYYCGSSDHRISSCPDRRNNRSPFRERVTQVNNSPTQPTHTNVSRATGRQETEN